jgi:hypothetical protein
LKNGERLSEEIQRLVLPFLAPSSDRVELLSEETERAAIFYLSELERKKGGGIIGKQPPEKIKVIAKASYPFWLFPFHEANLVFDGFKTTSHRLSYPLLPDIQTLIDDIDRSSSSRQVYMSFLLDSTNYFQESKKDETALIEGLLVDPAFLKDFNPYLSEARPLEDLPTEIAVLKPTISEASIASAIQRLDGLRSKFESELDDLDRCIKLLKATTESFVDTIQNEMKGVKAKYDAELNRRKGPVEEQVKEIRTRYDASITVTSKGFEKELLHLQREKVKRQKTNDRLTGRISRCEAEIKSSAANKDSASQKRWKEERKKIRKERSLVESGIKKIDEQIKETEDEKAQELFKIRSDCDSKVQEASKELLEIESARDAKVQVLEQEMEKMEAATSAIIKQIDSSSKLREKSIAAFEKYGIPRKYDEGLLVYVPFYLVCFQSEGRKRYVCYPPSNVNNVKLLVKLKGALGVARIKQLFSPRSTAIASFLNRFPLMLNEKPAFEREVNEAVAELNMLQTKASKESVRFGLNNLDEEGWISEKEHASVLRELK